jgi:anthranilate synthase component 2/putative glutamine amidotransferase
VSRPLIGVSSYREQAAWGVWDQDAAVLPYGYVDCVAAAGGNPLLLAPIDVEDRAQAAAGALAALHGLVLSGGPDLDPVRYGEPPHPETGAPRTQRDAWELALLNAALDAGLPVLGVCRGAQLMNVARGGTLIQHLPQQPGAVDHRAGTGRFRGVGVTLDPGALPGSVLGPSVEVSCYHHQAIGRLGKGLSVTGRAADGTVEAIEATDTDGAFAVGVQWHPETDHELRLFAALVEAAARYREAAHLQKEEPAQR